ncbi:MAG: DUF2252 family protein [Candidatus Obscuribacterales bacterium]|nr:DUF2252 family protein [Candidatus Obscuribacterales bacterium]
MKSMDIVTSTELYEKRFLARHTQIVQADLYKKYNDMASDPFLFFRATAYQRICRFPVVCPRLFTLPKVLAVIDLHVDNYGTYRDHEGRLIWAINDFDEVFLYSFAVDLVHLAASVKFAIESGRLGIGFGKACRMILEGYSESLACGGRPFVLQEEHQELRAMAVARLKDPVAFFDKLKAQTTRMQTIPDVADSALKTLFPLPDMQYKAFQRTAGEGSLGRQRFVALSELSGGLIAREVKAALPSCALFAEGKYDGPLYYTQMLDNAVRARDPFLKVVDKFIARRLAPDCSRIELTSLPKDRDEALLLWSMGFDAGNHHLGSKEAIPAVQKALGKLKDNWLRDNALAMQQDNLGDFKVWRKHWKNNPRKDLIAANSQS